MKIGGIKNNFWQYLTVLFLAVILLLTLLGGYHAGQAEAKTEVIFANASALQKGLNYFYSDQGRFPSEDEFANHDTMSPYFSSFPPANLIDKTCTKSFVYARTDLQNYQMNFCLPKALNGFGQGWNKSNSGKNQ